MNNPNLDKVVEQARDTVTAHLKKEGKAVLADIVRETNLQKELVANVLAKYTDQFDWTLRGGDFEREFFLKPGKG
jgi:hypothetical protein